MYKKDLALNNLQQLICHKSKSNKTKSKIFGRKYPLPEKKIFQMKWRGNKKSPLKPTNIVGLV